MTSKTATTSPAQLRKVLVELFPQQGAWSEEGYLQLTDYTNRLIEFTDGYIEVLPMPTDKHQAILQFLFLAFHAFIIPLGGKVRVASLRLRIRDDKFREPDLLLVRNAADPRRQNRFWTGADLVLEVVSPDDRQRDLVRKRRDYAEGKVPEYWIVDPETEKITVLVLDRRRYRKLATFGRGRMARSSLLEGFEVEVDKVFDAD